MPEREIRKRATALRYEPGAHAPTVVATGVGLIAERLLQTAEEAGVPITHDPALAEALGVLQLEGEIPPELYAAVAETLAWAYRLDARASGVSSQATDSP
jgi:flagellar biosynthesis protein